MMEETAQVNAGSLRWGEGRGGRESIFGSQSHQEVSD